MDLICQKLELQSNETVLDIGCGWGSFAELAARKYGVHVTGLTISREQQQLAEQRCKDLPVQIELKDYRKMEGTFDKLVSIGMFEHVGQKNYDTYMRTAYDLMKDDGISYCTPSAATSRFTSPIRGFTNTFSRTVPFRRWRKSIRRRSLILWWKTCTISGRITTAP